tara:strand:+ start:2184 stop:2798 length:615 start_codon:yes stop_codon:yes gene_type:complete
MTVFLYAKIIFICLLGAMSPGPSMIVVINNAIFKGRSNGILTAIGHGVGIGIYALFAVIGIGLLIQTNIVLFKSIKILSIIFLFYLGVQAIIKKKNIDFQSNNLQNGTKSFLQGLAISILNPKILIWFIAIYSQFMSVNNDYFLNISLIIIASIVDVLWYLFLVCIVTSKVIFELIQNKLSTLETVVGYIFIIISLILLVNIFI